MSASSEPVIPIVGSTATALASVFKIDLRFYSGVSLAHRPFMMCLFLLVYWDLLRTGYAALYSQYFVCYFYRHAVLSWVEFVSSFTDKQGRAFMQYAFCAWHAGFSFRPWRPPDVTVTEQTDFLMQGGREGGVSISAQAQFVYFREGGGSISESRHAFLLALRGFTSEEIYIWGAASLQELQGLT